MRHGYEINTVRPCNSYRFPIPFQYFQHNLKLKTGVNISSLSYSLRSPLFFRGNLTRLVALDLAHRVVQLFPAPLIRL